MSKIKITCTLIAGLAWAFFYKAYIVASGAIEGQASVAQLEDSTMSYTYAKFMMNGAPLIIATIFLLLVFLALWGMPLYKWIESLIVKEQN